MPTLTITRGLPACGKTTWARAWVAENPGDRARVNRDDIRAMLHGARLGTAEQELQVTALSHAAITGLLRRGTDVVSDDTNLVARNARNLRRLAVQTGADFRVVDLTDVPVQTCIDRDAARPAPVGEEVIRELWERYVRGRAHPLPLPDEPDPVPSPAPSGLAVRPYQPPAGASPAVMVDIDGTVAVMCGRSPYDETRVGEDTPNAAVITAVRAMHAAGHAVIFCSGRTAGCRPATERWLAEHVGVPYEALHMRAVGDNRKDSVVKAEIFDREIRHRYDVVAVFDDRRQVVDAWRAMGLTVFQVAPGDF